MIIYLRKITLSESTPFIQCQKDDPGALPFVDVDSAFDTVFKIIVEELELGFDKALQKRREALASQFPGPQPFKGEKPNDGKE